MRRRMGPDRFEEWLVWMQDEGILRGIADLRLQYLLATLSNTIGGGKLVNTDSNGKQTRAGYRLSDFPLPWVPATTARRRARKRQQERAMSPEATRKHVAGVMAAFGGIDPRYTVRKPPGSRHTTSW